MFVWGRGGWVCIMIFMRIVTFLKLFLVCNGFLCALLE